MSCEQSSVYAVVSNDDLLVEILLRLPALSLHLFKLVSKRWLSLIKDTRFTRSRSLIRTVDPPSGLFICRNSTDLSRYKHDFVSFDNRIPCKTSFAFRLGVRILHSCNGLLLCSTGALRSKIYVYNPSVNQCKMIPETPIGQYFDDDIKIVFDPTKSPYYKLINVVSTFDELAIPVTRTQIYFSKTGVWSVCGNWYDQHSFHEFWRGKLHNDAIHWLNNYTKPPLHHKLDILNENPLLTNIQLPAVDEKVVWDPNLFESCGCLLLLGKDFAHTQKLTIYEMRNVYSEWALKYIVNIDDISTYINRLDVLCIVLGEREEDSFMVIRLPPKIVQYRIMLKTLHTLCFYSKATADHDIQFIASYAAI